MAPDVDELTEGDPEVAVLENARRKARAGLELARGEGIVLGVDTDVVLDGRLLGKPADAAAARARLEALSGTTHEVLSGLVLLGTGGEDQRQASSGNQIPISRSADSSESEPWTMLKVTSSA